MQEAIGQSVRERLMPLTYHGGEGYSLFAFLWGCFLECGPDLEALLWRLLRMRGWRTDIGMGSSIIDAHDAFPTFVAAVGIAPHPSQEF